MTVFLAAINNRSVLFGAERDAARRRTRQHEDNASWSLHRYGVTGRAAAVSCPASATGRSGHADYAERRGVRADCRTRCRRSGKLFRVPPRRFRIQSRISIGAVRDSSWWQPHGMAASVDDGLPATDIHYVRVYRKIPETSEWPQFLVLYIDGNLRLIPHPPEGMARVCFGSSVIVGPAAMSARPANDAEGTCGWSARFRQPSCRVAMVRGPAIE